ncbi:MAG: ShlB/FhaC/HecB family hemolysin secretion/activation protein [Rhodanobacter sp.]
MDTEGISTSRRGTVTARWLFACIALLPCLGLAQTSLDQQEQRDRAQRDAQQREQLRSAPDVRLQAPQATDYRQSALPVEAPCFKVASLRLDGPRHAEVAFAQRYLDGYSGRCVGQQGLQLIQHRLADLILARGYVTTRVVIPEQNLAGGSLHLVLVPGTLSAVRYAPGSATVNWQSAFPLRPGDLLNLRAIEQGLEQLKRVPSQEVKIDITPGAVPGTSDLVLTVTRSKFWRYTLNEDDGGADATGKEQGGISLALDQPLGINDLLTLGVTHQVGRYHGDKGTHGSNLSYSAETGTEEVKRIAKPQGQSELSGECIPHTLNPVFSKPAATA